MMVASWYQICFLLHFGFGLKNPTAVRFLYIQYCAKVEGRFEKILQSKNAFKKEVLILFFILAINKMQRE